MPPADEPYTYNELSNEDKELLRANGHVPGDLSPEDEHELINELREARDSSSDFEATNADEQDGTDSI